MRTEIIAVGTELLLGEIVNTDAPMIAQGLAELGIGVYFQTVCGDNPDRLKSVLEVAKQRADLIITTGGLGPTADDLTKETIAAAFGKGLVRDEESMARLREHFKGRTMTQNNEKQADVPEGSTVFQNDWGTAPACAFEGEGCLVIMLPGPPRECTPLFREKVMPFLEKRRGGALCSRYVKVFGMGESEMASRLSRQMDSWENPTAAPYAKEGECLVRITAMGKNKEEAFAMTEPAVREVRQVLGDVVYGVDVDSLEQVVVQEMTARGLTLATAESCTGGLMGKRITDVPGASACYLGGVVSYHNEVKENLLGVRHETLMTKGAVSEDTACQMAQGVRKALGADIGISTTGVAGPGGGTPEKPVGLIYVGISTGDRTWAVRILRPRQSRESLRRLASSTAFDLVRRHLEGIDHA
ncbi:competence/damage-inducible protein A [Intestinimonas butyriciproducens]|uniref:competence/damage-inducible protein A n=1 Tax=Intestinimonas butyriciproducens TaxID=1297617 RepID=UPI00195CE8E5|nr:competence/damage-inducible protein A [Intestinimonas butyriciproducens]